MNRLMMIAAREYLAYVRTPGFWLSILLLPVGLSVIALAPVVMSRTTPVPTLAVVDFTHRNITRNRYRRPRSPQSLALASVCT